MKKSNLFSNGAFGLAHCLVFSAVIVGIVLLCVCHAGCQITTEGIKVLAAEESPVITRTKVLNENSLEVQFNKAVKIKSATVSKLDSGQNAALKQLSGKTIATTGILSEDGTSAIYIFEQNTDIGQKYQLFAEIADSRGNSLTFAIPFYGYNNRMPIVVLEEISGKDSNTADNKKKLVSKCDYIVLRALTEGNIAGLQVFSPRYPVLSAYEFPNLEVKAGEQIMLHLRTYEGQEYIEELGDDFRLDKNVGSRDYIRDLYPSNPKNERCASYEYDVILLKNKSAVEIMDCVVYTTAGSESKLKKYSNTINLAINENKWFSNSQEDGNPFVMEKEMTATGKCLRRKNSDELLALAKKGELAQSDIISSKDDWFVGVTLYNTDKKTVRP